VTTRVVFAVTKSAPTIRALLPYRSMYAARAQGDTTDATASQRVYRFKKNGESAATWQALVDASRRQLRCSAVWVIPPHDKQETSQLQKLYGITITRKRTVEPRKYNKPAPLDIKSLKFPALKKGSRVLLLDDITSTGITLRGVAAHLKTKGVHATPLALGMFWRQLPKDYAHTAVALNQQFDTVAANQRTTLPGDKGSRFRAKGRDLRRLLVVQEGVELYQKGITAGLPKVGNPKRKAAAAESLELFASTYLGNVFTKPISKGQSEDFQSMQEICRSGGRYAFASPRGDGKTSRVEAAILWAALYGYRHCIVIVGADLGAAQEICDSVKTELRINELLREDFPLPCWAATLTDDTALKAKGWTWGTSDLSMIWDKQKVILPLYPGADASGCVIVPRGLTGRLRGMRLKVGKKAIRPDFFAVDDPQTDESASSPSQCDTRERLLLGAVLGSGGPGESVAAMLPCTVIKYEDLAHRMLDHKRHPDWQGKTRSMVNTWPAAKDHWSRYRQLRKTEGHPTADAYYETHREAMDKGAEVDWPERYNPDTDVNALHHAENLLTDLGDTVFYAEYQNTPNEENPSVYDLRPHVIISRTDPNRPEYVVPKQCKIVTAFTDVNFYGLHWAALGFANDTTASVLSYGVRTGKNGAAVVPKNTPEAEAKRIIYEALVRNGQTIAQLPLRYDGKGVSVGLWIIDGGFMHDVVQRYATTIGKTLGIPVMVSRGYSADRYRPSGKWVIGKPREGCHLTESGLGKYVAFNQHYWCEIAQKAWLGSLGAPGSLSLFAGRNHAEFSEQICREKLIEKLRGKSGWFWKYHTQPGKHDYGDAVYGCYVAAAWAGLTTAGTAAPVKQKRYIETRRAKVGAL